MNDETSDSISGSTSAQPQADKNKPVRSWLDRIAQLIHGEVKDRDELLELLREAESNNLIDTYALLMIEGVLQVSEMQVRDIMIPRSQMVIIERNQTLEEVLPVVIDSAHSRFPVVGDNKDEVIGILLAKDLLPYALETSSSFNIRELLRPAVFIPESKRLNVLLREFRSSRNHMAIVVDEYGGIAGLVTIEDVLEQIVGEIEDEHDIEDDIYIIEHENGKSIVKAITPIDDFNEHFNASLKSDGFETVGGLVLDGFAHVPKRGEMLTIDEYSFKVLRSSSRRVHLLEVEKIQMDDTSSVEEQVTESAADVNSDNERKTG